MEAADLLLHTIRLPWLICINQIFIPPVYITRIRKEFLVRVSFIELDCLP